MSTNPKLTSNLIAGTLVAIFVTNLYLVYSLVNQKNDSLPETAGAHQIVTVDVDEVFNKHSKRLLSQKAIDEKAQLFSEETEKLTEQARATAAELEKDRLALKEIKNSAKNKEAEATLVEKVKELRAFEIAVTQKVRSYKEQIGQESSKASADILEEIYAVIKRKSEALGYKQVINSKAVDQNGVPVVLYNQDGIDLTSAVIEAVNQGQ